MSPLASAPKIKIAVVDDVPETRTAIADALSRRGLHVQTFSPERALAALKNEQFEGLVLDLRLGKIEGAPRDGIELLRGLGEKAPPTVLATGSVGAPTALAIASAAITPSGIPALRVFSKARGFADLSSHLDLAISDSVRVTAAERAATINSLTIPNLEISDPLERRALAADVAERLRNYLALAQASLPSESSAKPVLMLREQHDALATFSATRIFGLSPADTNEALHEIVNRLAIADPGSLRSSSSSRELSRAHSSLMRFLSDTRNDFDRRRQPTFVLESELDRLFEDHLKDRGIYYADKPEGGKITLKDDSYLLRSFFEKFAERAKQHQFALDIRYHGQRTMGEYGHLAKAQKALQCGAAVSVSIRFLSGEAAKGPAWAQFKDLMFEVHALRKAGIFWADGWNFEPDLESLEGFNFYLKATEFDDVAHAAEVARVASIQVAPLKTLNNWGNDLSVSEVKVGDRSFIAIDIDPVSLMRWNCDLTFLGREDKSILVSASKGHADGDLVVYLYLTTVLGIEHDVAFQTARFDTIRLKLNQTKCLVDRQSLGETGHLTEIMNGLGIDEVMAAPREFCGRVGLSRMQIPDDDDMELFSQSEDPRFLDEDEAGPR